MKKLQLVTPGEILLEEWLKPMGVSQYRLAIEIGMPPRRINEIVHGKRAITADTALGSLASSEPMRSPGSTCNHTTTWKKPSSKQPGRCCKKSCPGRSGRLLDARPEGFSMMAIMVNVREAQTHFCRLLEQAHAGQEIILLKAGKPYARMVPLG